MLGNDARVLVFSDNLVNPVLDGGHSGVDSRIVRLAAPNTPAHNTNLNPVRSLANLHWATRVSLQHEN